MTEHTSDEVQQVYLVVVNHEEQYSIWEADLDIPAGWTAEGFRGANQDCLDHIGEVWTDMRPLSLRRHMEEQERLLAENPEPAPVPEEPAGPSLAARLSAGEHPVEASLRPDPTAQALAESIERGYVLVLFSGTSGGTELGVTVDPEATDTSGADFAAATGTVRIVGHLVLDFEPVRCVAEIDLSTLRGQGHLELSETDEMAI